MRPIRRKTGTVTFGRVSIGGKNPIAVQTMASCNTLDTATCAAQIAEVRREGCRIVRFAVQGMREAENLRAIRKATKALGVDDVALVADVHFLPEVALAAAEYADKVRINPGNYSRIGEFRELIARCRRRDVALRIGVNHGSLSPQIAEQYGDTPEGMVESAMRFLRICHEERFDRVVVSMKSSNVLVMIEAYRRMVTAMDAEEMPYPLHLGVTEAGNGLEGRTKSVAGIATLLAEGIGDTIRLSLTEPPCNEVVAANKLVDYIAEGKHGSDFESFIIKSTAEFAPALLSGRIRDFKLEDERFTPEQQEELRLAILQAAHIRITRTEYIACPGCGRTKYDLQGALERVKERTKGFAGLKIAVMGCIVNGPGEMADADFGYVGAAPGRVTIYRGGDVVAKNIPEEKALDELVRLIVESGHEPQR